MTAELRVLRHSFPRVCPSFENLNGEWPAMQVTSSDDSGKEGKMPDTHFTVLWQNWSRRLSSLQDKHNQTTSSVKCGCSVHVCCVLSLRSRVEASFVQDPCSRACSPSYPFATDARLHSISWSCRQCVWGSLEKKDMCVACYILWYGFTPIEGKEK